MLKLRLNLLILNFLQSPETKKELMSFIKIKQSSLCFLIEKLIFLSQKKPKSLTPYYNYIISKKKDHNK